MNSDQTPPRWLARLRAEAERPVPRALDHRVRTALRTLPLERPTFALPTMALGLAVAATLAMTVSLALALASAGAGESGVVLATVLVAGYLGVSSVVVLPLLARRRSARPAHGVPS